ncbi:DUF3545 family protein [Psychromonas algicola]|uniref:DUF3545 family protein n=1 Tax=Psychromonas algicola TaxID=2555642 RepID=UPI00106822BE|nr:DUF3545 family protein [Psychromonas sp. RZ5]TEW50647.1 DUF3545 family protein [Psychromonas sp. RZ5]
MQEIQFNDLEMNNDKQHLSATKRQPKPRKWREIEEMKAKLLLARELREIDPSFSFSQGELN